MLSCAMRPTAAHTTECRGQWHANPSATCLASRRRVLGQPGNCVCVLSFGRQAKRVIARGYVRWSVTGFRDGQRRFGKISVGSNCAFLVADLARSWPSRRMHGELPYGYFSSTTLTAARSGYRPICRWHSCTSEPRHHNPALTASHRA